MPNDSTTINLLFTILDAHGVKYVRQFRYCLRERCCRFRTNVLEPMKMRVYELPDGSLLRICERCGFSMHFNDWNELEAHDMNAFRVVQRLGTDEERLLFTLDDVMNVIGDKDEDAEVS